MDQSVNSILLYRHARVLHSSERGVRSEAATKLLYSAAFLLLRVLLLPISEGIVILHVHFDSLVTTTFDKFGAVFPNLLEHHLFKTLLCFWLRLVLIYIILLNQIFVAAEETISISFVLIVSRDERHGFLVHFVGNMMMESVLAHLWQESCSE